MNKFLKGAVCAGLCCSMLAAVGCKKAKLDPEKRQLTLATAALDGNFNPFFYTSQNDGNMISMTQISMLTVDSDGKLVCGENWPTAVLEYNKTYYDAKEQGTGSVIPEGIQSGRTEYEFVIKNGIKFSDGEPLTVKDVLFNLYVYLDPAYTGSSTMYSTDIQGLKAYRSQDPSIADDQDSRLEETFVSEGQNRIDALIEWSEDMSITESVPSDTDLKKDYDTVCKLFREEAESDWTSVSTSWSESYKDTHRFTAAWQAYLFNENIVRLQEVTNTTTGGVDNPKDENGKYYTTLDNNSVTGEEPVHQAYIDGIAAATTQAKIDEFLAKPENQGSSVEYAKEQLEKQYCVDVVVSAYTVKSSITNIVQWWATAERALEAFTGEARSSYFQDIKDNHQGELVVKTISGIKAGKKTVNGVEHDTVKIVINGVDPKAIYNFSFVVAPMHYYSGVYNGVDYSDAEHANGSTKFGVDMGNKDFYDKVVNHIDKNGLPVGAGAYKATSYNGSENPSRSDFFHNNIVYFTRNDNFTTLGSGISNAKIKLVNYKVMGGDKIMEALIKGEIDYGTPDATYDNQSLVTANRKSLGSADYANSGYGYVGINPKFVPEYPIRRAIMKTMDTTMTVAYFSSSLADTVYRSQSTTSWAYPKDAQGNLMAGVANADKYQHETIKYTTVDKELEALVESAGYTKSGGKYVKTRQMPGMANAKNGTRLKFTFTIAGETTKHPAYAMFNQARDRLNALGFDITVSTDIQALKKMTTGNLAVWAAAWSSSIDPDMYQVWHKDSRATSVLNWNYRNIMNDSSTWRFEYDIIAGEGKLSDLIERAREIDSTDENAARSARAEIYADCLDLTMQLAVELPTYQRKDLCVYNKNVISAKSLVQNPNYNIGLFDRIWEIDYV